MTQFQEHGHGHDAIGVATGAIAHEYGKWQAHWEIEKFADEAAHAANTPYEVCELPGNLLLNEGITALLTLLIGGAATAYNNANARLGVGDSAVAAVATQTGLQAATNRTFRPMDATFPSVAGQTVTFRATFGAGVAAYAWNEFTVVNGVDDTAVNLCRRVDTTIGTKGSSPVWVLTLTVTIG